LINKRAINGGAVIKKVARRGTSGNDVKFPCVEDAQRKKSVRLFKAGSYFEHFQTFHVWLLSELRRPTLKLHFAVFIYQTIIRNVANCHALLKIAKKNLVETLNLMISEFKVAQETGLSFHKALDKILN
jgi:hypothetical protein